MADWRIGINPSELTKQLAEIPQVKELQLSFAPAYGAPQQGKWMIIFPVIEIRYTYPPSISGQSNWEINVYPVPRNMRAKIREAFISFGFKNLAEWLRKHAGFSGRASHLRFRGQWDSNLDELNFNSYDNILPDISIAKQEK